MQLIPGSWTGTLIGDDGRHEAEFSLSSVGIMECNACEAQAVGPALTIAGRAPVSFKLLEGARNALVALAHTVPESGSGALAQVLLEIRMLGDRLVGHWMRRDMDGAALSAGTLVAVRAGKAA